MAHYREIRPAGPVADLLECAWQARADAPHVQRVLPDGCMDLLVQGGRLVVAGPDTTAHLASSPAGSVTTGLRFRPGRLPALLGVPAEELRDTRTALDALLARPLPGPGGDPGEAPGTPLALLLEVAAALRAGADAPARTLPAPLPPRALRALARGMPVTELADRLGVTSRTLHRRCRATLGYGPAVARRVLRFRTASALLFDGVTPAEVAARTGYADQPHLSREVRSLAGLSPTALAPAPAGDGAAQVQANRSSDVPSGSRTVA